MKRVKFSLWVRFDVSTRVDVSPRDIADTLHEIVGASWSSDYEIEAVRVPYTRVKQVMQGAIGQATKGKK